MRSRVKSLHDEETPMKKLNVKYEVGDLIVKRKERLHYLVIGLFPYQYKLMDLKTEEIVVKSKTEIHTTAYKKRG
jgi:hypothetical protein